MKLNKIKHQKGYRFLDFWVGYCLILIFLVIVFIFPGVVFADELHFQAIDSKEYFSLLISTTGAFLGILVAAFLLTFQLINKEAKRRKEGNILHNPWVISFGCLSIFLMIASTICYIIVPNFNEDNFLTLGYYLLYLFISFLLLVFPVLRILLNNTNTLTLAQTTIASLTVQDFSYVITAYYNGTWINNDTLKLARVRDEVLYAVRDNDNSALHTMLMNLTEKSNDLLPTATREQADAVCSAMTILWKDAEGAASSSNNTSFYEIVSNCVETLYQHAAVRQIPLLYFQSMRQYYNELSENLTRNANIAGLRKVISVLEISLKLHLKGNCPEEDSLKHLLKLYKQPVEKYSSDAEIQWGLINDFIYDINRIQQLAIDQSLKDLYLSAARTLKILASHIEHNDFPGLGKFQRAYILTNLISLYILYNAEKALANGLFEDTLETYRLDGSLIADVIVKDPAACSKILQDIADHLINARRKGQLNHWWTLNEFGSIPRHTAKHYFTNETVRIATRYIFEVLKNMKEEIETSNELPKESKTYDEIKSQLEALESSLKEYDKPGKQTPFVNDLQSCIASFKPVQAISNYNIIPWPPAE